jgi:hypothetical protein
MPTKRGPSHENTPWSPKPPFGVHSSRAWLGLTVTTASANTSPPFSTFSCPYHSRRRQLNSAGGMPSVWHIAAG